MSQSLFIIYDTQEDTIWKANSKIAWISKGAAKNAWNLAAGYGGTYALKYADRLYFDDQSRYILVEITDNDVLEHLRSKL